MRFMMLMIPKGYTEAEPGAMPTAEMIAAMMKYNEALAQAGVLLSLDGLHPPSTAVRVRFGGGRAIVTDGPFAEAKEAIGGYWLIRTGSRDEAIAWASRCPAQDGDVIEVRQVHDMDEFPPESVPEMSPELRRRGEGS